MQVIDPWGAVIAQASDVTDQVVYADIDLEYLKQVRQGMPVWNHRRPEIYGDLPSIAGSASKWLVVKAHQSLPTSAQNHISSFRPIFRRIPKENIGSSSVEFTSSYQ